MSIKLIIKLCVFTLLFWTFYFSNSPMEWTKRHDTMLFREVLVVNPYQAKKKTVQRGQLWQTVAGNLVQLEDPVFKKSLSKRSVQDRCTLLCEKHKKRMKYETKASGISPNVTELDNLIEETLEKEEASEELRATQGIHIYKYHGKISLIYFKNFIIIMGKFKAQIYRCR